MIKKVTNAQYVMIKNASHEINKEKPEELATVMRHFLSDSSD